MLINHFFIAGISCLLKSFLVHSQFNPNLDYNQIDPQYPRYQIIDNIKVYSQPQYVDRERFSSRDSNYNPQDPLNYEGKFVGNNYNPPQLLDSLPGVLHGWRPDLQGRSRTESLNLNSDRDVTVSTPYGQIQGFKVNLYDNPLPESGYRPDQTNVEIVRGTVSVFLGIPYALPPVGDAKFKPPRSHPSWRVLYAADYGPICPQPVRSVLTANKRSVVMNDDCLYLNIFTPSTKSGIGKPYPVMMYIHGGDFTTGSSNSFPAHVMAAFYDVVVVTFNYRLGALGFLSTGDHNSPGNYGIMDQAMALRWVYENINNFNGDRHSITLFGPDAGAASAGLLMVNSRTAHMVAKVIAQSGSAMADWALIQDRWRAENTSKVFAKSLGCNIDTSWKVVDCLRGRNPLELGNVNFKPDIGLLPWGPVLDVNISSPVDDRYQGWSYSDWHFASETVEASINSRKFNKNLAYMSGITTQEAAYFLYNNDTLKPTYEVDERFFDQKVREFVQQYNYSLNPKGTYDAIKFMYTNWPDPQCRECIRTQFINMLSDFLYVGPHDKMAKLLLQQNVPIWLYVQNTTIEAFKLPEWGKAYHNIEHAFLMGAPFLDSEMVPMKNKISKLEWSFNDRNMSHFFMKAFTNFAKYGNPTFTEILGIHFDQAKTGQLFYLNINTTFNSSILFNYRQTESAFWTDYIPLVTGRMVPLYYPPYFDFWWEQSSPVHVAFWSLTLLCMLLFAMSIILCMLWLNSKREVEHYYNDEFLTLEKESELHPGIENRSHSNSNIYEYRDTPSLSSNKTKPLSIGKMGSTAPSSRTDLTKVASVQSVRSSDSILSLREHQNLGNMFSGTPRPVAGREYRNKLTELKDGIPQTAV